MSNDYVHTQRVVTSRLILWLLLTCSMVVAAFALAWILRAPRDSQRDGGDDLSQSVEGCGGLTARLADAEARLAEGESENRRFLMLQAKHESFLTKQLEYEKSVRECTSKLDDAEAAREAAVNDKNRLTARTSDCLSQSNLTNSKVGKLTTDNDDLRRKLEEQIVKSRTENNNLRSRVGAICIECGIKCPRTCPR